MRVRDLVADFLLRRHAFWRRYAVGQRLRNRQFVLIGLDKLSMTQKIRIVSC
jgi:hypothetical protein